MRENVERIPWNGERQGDGTFLIANSARSREQSRSICTITNIILSRGDSGFTGVCRGKKTSIERGAAERRILANAGRETGGGQTKRQDEENRGILTRGCARLIMAEERLLQDFVCNLKKTILTVKLSLH